MLKHNPPSLQTLNHSRAQTITNDEGCYEPSILQQTIQRNNAQTQSVGELQTQPLRSKSPINRTTIDVNFQTQAQRMPQLQLQQNSPNICQFSQSRFPQNRSGSNSSCSIQRNNLVSPVNQEINKPSFRQQAGKIIQRRRSSRNEYDQYQSRQTQPLRQQTAQQTSHWMETRQTQTPRMGIDQEVQTDREMQTAQFMPPNEHTFKEAFNSNQYEINILDEQQNSQTEAQNERILILENQNSELRNDLEITTLKLRQTESKLSRQKKLLQKTIENLQSEIETFRSGQKSDRQIPEDHQPTPLTGQNVYTTCLRNKYSDYDQQTILSTPNPRPVISNSDSEQLPVQLIQMIPSCVSGEYGQQLTEQNTHLLQQIKSLQEDKLRNQEDTINTKENIHQLQRRIDLVMNDNQLLQNERQNREKLIQELFNERDLLKEEIKALDHSYKQEINTIESNYKKEKAEKQLAHEVLLKKLHSQIESLKQALALMVDGKEHEELQQRFDQQNQIILKFQNHCQQLEVHCKELLSQNFQLKEQLKQMRSQNQVTTTTTTTVEEVDKHRQNQKRSSMRSNEHLQQQIVNQTSQNESSNTPKVSQFGGNEEQRRSFAGGPSFKTQEKRNSGTFSNNGQGSKREGK